HIVVFVICHHPHVSDTRLSLTTQQLYLVTLQHNLTLAMFHLCDGLFSKLISYGKCFYMLECCKQY
ncbi:hypothetical protein BCR42DRAFT_407373, partial [Absidia repens]